jgi:hypothetical protein
MPGAGARILRAAVGFALVSPTEPDLRVLHPWMNCWRGISNVAAGGLTTSHGPAAPDRGSPPVPRQNLIRLAHRSTEVLQSVHTHITPRLV